WSPCAALPDGWPGLGWSGAPDGVGVGCCWANAAGSISAAAAAYARTSGLRGMAYLLRRCRRLRLAALVAEEPGTMRKIKAHEEVQPSATAAARTRLLQYVPAMEHPPHILVVDDDREIRDLLAKFLERHRMRITAVLDLMLPGESGLDLARWMRSQSDIPIVMLTAMGEETDRIIGLELGADDYMPKPFNPRELLARIRAVLRRAGDAAEHRADPAARTLRFNGWSLEPARRRLLNPEGAEVALTGGEY